MSAHILDGKALAEKIRLDIAREAVRLAVDIGRPPGLVAVLVGDDPASEVYVSRKHEACRKAGFYSEIKSLPKDSPQSHVLKVVHQLNEEQRVDGFIVQLPLPDHLSEAVVLEAVLPEKDVDGFHPVNQGKLLFGSPGFVSATPKGIMRLLKEYGITLQGKHVVVVGRSNIVGKPAAILFLRENATVTVCHSKTKNLPEITSQADVLVSAVGKPGLITADHVAEGAVVVDVGITRMSDDKLKGDVLFDEVKEKAAWITPVPGGVGPMTIAMLLENTLEAYKKRNGL